MALATRASRAELNHALADGVDSINKIHVLASGPRWHSVRDQLQALLILGCIGYVIRVAWRFLVLLVSAPSGSLFEALSTAEVDDEEEDRQRRRRRREEYDDLNRA